MTFVVGGLVVAWVVWKLARGPRPTPEETRLRWAWERRWREEAARRGRREGLPDWVAAVLLWWAL